MTDHARNLALLLAGAAFVLFILFKRGLPLPLPPRTPAAREALRRIAEAKRRAADLQASPAARAGALREAATVALESLRHPGLAAAYARRAERLDPDDPATIGLLASSLRRASRYRALERLLWRKLASAEPEAPGTAATVTELIALYSGPLARPEIAQGLRRMHLSPSPAGAEKKEAG